ncbi:MAG TPA: hypothetical protein VFW45_04580 [Candidatus Polarisedimenticolia bacterium]|nr:hypothetical protein [Candidatus Polarisedimenticolia bacterium]
MPTNAKVTSMRAHRTRKNPAKSDPAVSYDDFKEYEGRKYTGMKIGRSHKWYYDEGEWKETKITPDLWEISYAVTKRRAGHAPEGSGVPVGTEYHWYILAHQNVRKLNANDYTTSLTGLKFKIAHKRANSEKWSATLPTQRKRMAAFLRDVIADLESVSAEEPEKPVVKPKEAKPAPRRERRAAPAGRRAAGGARR